MAVIFGFAFWTVACSTRTTSTACFSRTPSRCAPDHDDGDDDDEDDDDGDNVHDAWPIPLNPPRCLPLARTEQGGNFGC